jgi:multidrug efflux pump subunit AcrA (membrane-fusion protein)
MFRRTLNFLKAQPRWRIALAMAVVSGFAFWLSRGEKSVTAGATFSARRGPLQITVLEGGTIQALDSQELKCEVRVGFQGTKILRIVDEGYLVTEEDVKEGKTLVELDSSELQKQLLQQEIIFQTAAAALTDAQQAYDIQLNQNISDMMAVEQKARFARMDFEKFLGTKAADEVIKQLGVDEKLMFAKTNKVELHLPDVLLNPETFTKAELTSDGSTCDASNATPSAFAPASLQVSSAALSSMTSSASAYTPPEPPRPSSINFSKYADIDVLTDGEAKQKIRKFQDDLQVAQKEMGQAQSTLEGTRRLYAKQFVTRTDLQRDEIAYENTRLKMQTAGTARDLFLRYEFLRTSEETLSKYCEAVREVERARKAAVAKLAQAEARLRSATAQYNVQFRQRHDLQQQIEKCIIRAQNPGLVVYGRAGDDGAFIAGEERIREGATVRERQTILTIPETTHMGVKVKIHETYIKKIKVGQRTRITVDAFADKMLEGEVSKVSVLPDSQNRWMNPDLKVYLTTISIDGTQDWLKPGMSTKVEIFVDRLEDVVYVPIQSVVPEAGKYVCYIASGAGRAERREVEVGQFNEEFIEVKRGIAEDENVLLRPPKASAIPTEGESKRTPPSKQPAPATNRVAMRHSAPGR